MAGYLDTFGEADERRSRLFKRAALLVVLLLVVGLAGYFLLRNHKEKRQIQTFMELLRSKRFEEAYVLWGCTPTSPCKEYSLEKFMEDWGPQSKHPDAAAMQLVSLKSCDEGVIQLVKWGDDEIRLWVNRSDRTLSFAPWPICNPRMKVP